MGLPLTFAANLPSGGLGLTTKQWESLHGKSTGKGISGKMYGKYEVIDFGSGKIEPKDAKFIRMYNPAGRPETKVYLHSSKYLGGQFIYTTFTRQNLAWVE